jgi:hypothetical protein
MAGGPELIHAAQEIFQEYFITQYQGSGGRFRPHAQEADMRSAETATWHYTGKSTARRHPGGYAPVTASGIRHVPISATLEDWYDFEPTGAFDAAKTQSAKKRMKVAEALIKSIGRREDQECLSALSGATFNSTVANGGNYIAEGNTQFTFEKHEEAMEYFLSRGVAPEDVRAVLSEGEIRNIHHDASFANLDFRRGGARPRKPDEVANELGIGGVIVLGTKEYEGEGGLTVDSGTNVRDVYYYDVNRLGLASLEIADTPGALMEGFLCGVDWNPERLANVAWCIWSGKAKFLADPDDTDSEGVVKIESDTGQSQPT